MATSQHVIAEIITDQQRLVDAFGQDSLVVVPGWLEGTKEVFFRHRMYDVTIHGDESLVKVAGDAAWVRIRDGVVEYCIVLYLQHMQYEYVQQLLEVVRVLAGEEGVLEVSRSIAQKRRLIVTR